MSAPRLLALALLATLTACGQPAAPEAPAEPSPAAATAATPATGATPAGAATPATGAAAGVKPLPGKLARQAVPETVPGADARVVRAVLWGTDSVSEEAAREVFLNAAYELLARDQYDRLLQLEERCLAETSPFGDLTPWRSLFYDAFASPVYGSTDRTWEGLHERARRWTELHPDQVAPHLVRARAAWGAAQVEKDAAVRQGFVAVARQEAARARQIAPEDPEVARLEIQMGGKEAGRRFEAAVQRHADYVPLYRARWAQLDAKARAPFLAAAADRTKATLGESLYALLPEADPAALQKMFQGKLLDWPRMHQGFLDLLQRQPLSVPVHNRFCFMAAQAGEAAAADALFRRIGDQWDPQVWQTRAFFEEVREWVAAEAGKAPQASPAAAVQPLQTTLIPPGPERSFLFPDADARLMHHQYVDLWMRGRYPELEAIAATLRRQAVRLPWGDCALAQLYRTLTDYHGLSDEEWAGVLAANAEWQKAFPESPTPRVARAMLMTAYAWDARGSDLADTVSQKGWKLFGERLAEARKALDFPDGMEDDPHRHAELCWIAMAEGEQEERVGQEFQAALALDPGCSTAWSNRAVSLLPRWGGKPGDLGRLARTAAQEHGPATTAHVGWWALDYAGAEVFREDGLDFEDVQAGFQALMGQYGPAAVLRNRAAYAACLAGERSAAHSALEAVGADWDPALWSSAAHLARWKEWAASKDAPPPSEQAWARILDRGLYQGEPPQLTQSTDEIPARAGTRFGIRVQYEDWPAERPVGYRVQLEPATGEPRKQEGVVAAGDAPPPVFLWTLPEGLPPGECKVSLYLEDLRVAQQTFRVVPVTETPVAAPASPTRRTAAPPLPGGR